MSENREKNIRLLLSKVFGGGIKIENLETNGLSVGENYQSEITSVNLKVNNEKDTDQDDTRSVIMKMLPMNKDYREICDLKSLFKREVFMYETILPAYKKFEIDSGISENEVLNIAPRHYGSQLNSNAEIGFYEDNDTFIALENLRTQGYYKVDRKIGANLIHSKLAVQAMAKFHAIGIAIKHKNPNEFEMLKKESPPAQVKHPQDWIEIAENVYKIIESDSMIQKYVDSCKKLYKMEEDQRTSTPLEPWTSIIHGDFSSINILFHQKPDKSIPEDVKFVDFQNHTFTSPLRELAFFLAISADQEVFENHYDELLDLYYETLINRLTLFGVDTKLYSRESFNKQYIQDARLHFPHCIAVLQIVTLDVGINDEAVANLPKLLLQNSPRNDIFCEKLRKIILFYDGRGWFN